MTGYYCYTHFHRKAPSTSHSYLVYALCTDVRVGACETDSRFATLRLAIVILACTMIYFSQANRLIFIGVGSKPADSFSPCVHLGREFMEGHRTSTIGVMAKLQ
jgi:hypothetical protein